MDTGLRELLAATILLAVAFGVPRLLPRWPVWARMALRVAVLAGVTVLAGRLLGSPVAPRWAAGDPDRLLWQQLVEAGWWVLAGRVLVGLARLFLVLKNRPRETRILADLLAGAVYVATGLSVVTFAFSVPLGGLLATSGVIAIVLGLALQSTLSDVFSGIAVGLEKPYAAGDSIWVEGGIDGQVLEVNWRSTRIATRDSNVAVIPNSVIAKARLVNRSAPTPVRRDGVDIAVDPGADPARCIAALTAAVRNCATVLADPAPAVLCSNLAGDALGFRVSVSVAASRDLARARSELFVAVHRHLRHAGIALAVPGKGRPKPVQPPTLTELLAASNLFGAFRDADRDMLAGYLRPGRVEEGEVVLAPGDVPDALLLIASGTVGAMLPGPGGLRIVNRLGPGETLGAAGLVTGQPFTATATALTPLLVFRLDRDDLAAGVAAHPDLLPGLEALAERVVASMRRDATPDEAAAPGRAGPAEAFRHFLRALGARDDHAVRTI